MVQPVNGKAWQGRSARTAAVGALVLALVAGLAGCGEPSPAELISQARTALAKKDTEAARISLKSALQQAPDNGEARFLLGELLHNGGDMAGAAAADVRAGGWGDDPLQQLEQRRERAWLQAGMRRLPLGDRSLLALAYVHDMSLAQIARIEGVSEAAAKARLHRARGRLREILLAPDGDADARAAASSNPTSGTATNALVSAVTTGVPALATGACAAAEANATANCRNRMTGETT